MDSKSHTSSSGKSACAHSLLPSSTTMSRYEPTYTVAPSAAPPFSVKFTSDSEMLRTPVPG